MCDIVVKKFTFAISSPDEFLSVSWGHTVAHRPYTPDVPRTAIPGVKFGVDESMHRVASVS